MKKRAGAIAAAILALAMLYGCGAPQSSSKSDEASQNEDDVVVTRLMRIDGIDSYLNSPSIYDSKLLVADRSVLFDKPGLSCIDVDMATGEQTETGVFAADPRQDEAFYYWIGDKAAPDFFTTLYRTDKTTGETQALYTVGDDVYMTQRLSYDSGYLAWREEKRDSEDRTDHWQIKALDCSTQKALEVAALSGYYSPYASVKLNGAILTYIENSGDEYYIRVYDLGKRRQIFSHKADMGIVCAECDSKTLAWTTQSKELTVMDIKTKEQKTIPATYNEADVALLGGRYVITANTERVLVYDYADERVVYTSERDPNFSPFERISAWFVADRQHGQAAITGYVPMGDGKLLSLVAVLSIG